MAARTRSYNELYGADQFNILKASEPVIADLFRNQSGLDPDLGASST